MKKMFFQVSEFGEIQYLSTTKKIVISFLFLFFLFSNLETFAQTIPSTGSSVITCGDCTPTGWLDTGGTPDISNRNITGGSGFTGGSATWVNAPLPLPPTGHTTWITIRDVGPDFPEESVTTTIKDLMPNRYYVITVYAMSSITNQDGGNGNDDYYAGTYHDKFDYQIDTNPRQTIANVPKEQWGAVKSFFIGNGTGDDVELTLYPRRDSKFTTANSNEELLEAVNIAIEINAVDEIDTDGDGVPDSIDIDDDNDGILDTVELTISGITYDPLGDEDGDNLPNYLDTRDDNISSDGSTTDYNDINGDGIPNIYDFDNDGIPNHLDLDTDGDGIPDIIEAQTTSGYMAPSGAVGANGLDSAFENNDSPTATGLGGAGGTGLVNTNSTGNPDYLDLDSDGDGISDTIEGNITLTGNVGNNGLDNPYDNGDNYTDTNGNFDNSQLNNFPNTSSADSPDDVNWRDSATALQKDTDGDGVPDSVDIDDDNDGIRDLDECTTANTTASNADSVESQTGVTNSANAIGSNNARAILDNIDDILIMDLGVDVPANTIIEIESLVTDNINHFMGIEQSSDAVNFNNQKFYNWTAINTEENKQYKLTQTSRYIKIKLAIDGGGGQLEVDNVSYQSFITTCDEDGDGIPNQFDLDSDNDGIPDNIEGQPTGGYVAPSGSVGNNGLYNIYENNDMPTATSFTVINTDSANDAIPDYLDTDSDNDGVADRIEANLSLNGTYGANGLDTNYDNGDTYVDTNGNFDTTPYNDFPDNPTGGEVDWRDNTSNFSDTDNDGIPDTVDLDDDNDGILDTVEGNLDEICLDFSGISNGSPNFTGRSITFPTGYTTTYAGSLSGENYSIGTASNHPNTPTGNASGDFRLGVITGASGGVTGNYEEYTITFNNPVKLQIKNKTLIPGNFDGPDHWDITVNEGGFTVNDSGTADLENIVNTNNNITFDGTFSGNNIWEITTTSAVTSITLRMSTINESNNLSPLKLCAFLTADADGDGIPNHLDLDSDNDGIPDNIEAQSTTGYIIPDGIFGPNGVDTAYTGGLTPQDTDGDTAPDFLETDSDNDGFLDNVEAGIILSGNVGANGLDNNYDNGDNYTDVNGNFDNSQANNFPDTDGDVFSNGDVDYRDNTFTNDIDGDGVSDETDLDDDNDGILDSIEIGSCTPTATAPYIWETLYQVTSPNGTLASDGDDPSTAPQKTANNVVVTLSRTSNVASDSNYRVNDAITTNSSYNINQRGIIDALSRHVFDFSNPIYGLSFTIYDINEDNTQTIDNVEIILTQQDGTTYTLTPADYTFGSGINYNTTTKRFTGNSTTGATGPSTNLTINSIPAWITKMQLVYTNSGTGTVNLQQEIALGDLNFCTPLDSDGDGVFDYVDLDADNDGIPDNIEAQSTANYIAPTGNYSSTGIDLAYGIMGFTPENTDATATTGADTIPDYLDLDSDGDGAFDIVESGSGLTDTAGGADGRVDLDVTNVVGTNGLINSLDNGDTYNDVNGSFDNTVEDNFTDTDADVNIGGDLDYRDTVVGVDTDKDGIPNNIDIDDDNDGILDADELTNLSLEPGVTATQSSTRVGTGANVASAAIDGNTSGGFETDNSTTHTGDLDPAPSWTLDLSSSESINNITIYNRTDCCQERLDNFILEVLDTNNNVVFTYNHSGGVADNININIGDTSGQFVRVRLEGPNRILSLTEVEVYGTKDTDGDGISNHLDIDADNDGIPDNIEAQGTNEYLPPTGNDTDNDGLDDRYDTDCTSPNCGGITGVDISSIPSNTDDKVDLIPDYLDLDSDNDGIPDIQENGDSDNVISGNDTDGDGLDDNFEGSDINDGYDVNDEINTPSTDLPDIDSDLPSGDVDYRDTTNDPITVGSANNILWLRADIPSSITGTTTVTSWVDQTANPFTATATNGPEKIEGRLNFNPAMRFDGVNESMQINGGILGDNITYNNIWVYAVSLSNANEYAYTLSQGTGNTRFYLLTPDNDNPSEFAFEFGSASLIQTAWGANTGEFNLWNVGSSTGTATPSGTNRAGYRNGLRIVTDNQSSSVISNDEQNFFVGSIDGTQRYLDGEIAEIMVFDAVPSSIEQQQIQSYLAIKYGITLDKTDNNGNIVEGDYILTGGNPKVWDYTANEDYHNDVAGIGRDDAMVLNQKQSKSINSDAIITIGLDAIASTNILNTNTFTNNKDFLVWGNNNGAIATITETELICAPEKTIGRTWKIVENGAVGKTKVAADKALILAALNTANTLKVFKVADDAAFTSNVEYIPVVETATQLEVDFNFNGTKYFTYSEVNGIFWNGATTNAVDRWKGGNSASITGGPSTNVADVNKVMIIDSEGTSNHATLAEDVEVECVWIQENSKLMVQDNKYLEFDEDFILDGELKLIGNGQLIQTHTGLSNVQGTGKLYRDQAAIVPSIYRYHYWTSPVREIGLDTYKVGQVMKDGNAPTSETSTIREINWQGNGNIYDGAPGTAVPNVPIKIAPYWIYSYLNGTSPGDWTQNFQTGALERGQGFTMKSTGQNPQNFTFVGTPNDGSITFNLGANTTSLLGNPYPSALDAINFINTNINEIDGTIYFWEHTGEDEVVPASSEGHNLSGYQGGYSQRNISMGIAASGVTPEELLNFNGTSAIDNGNTITQVIDGITVTYSTSNNKQNLNTSQDAIGGTSGNYFDLDDANADNYIITISFTGGKKDISSIRLYNRISGNTAITLTPIGNNNTIINHTLPSLTGQTIPLNWEDISTFTISSSSAFNIVIDDLKFSIGNAPSLGGGTYNAPNRYIAVGQGFFVSSSSTGGTVRFENSMRNFEDDNYITDGFGGGTGTRFFKGTSKQNNEQQKDLLPILKLGFNYKSNNNISLHRQIGISFKRGNDFRYDNGYDSEVYDLGNTDFYWHFPDHSNKKLIIAGVSEIKKSLEVPLSIVLGSNGPFGIQVDLAKNINSDIYLLDKLTNTYYELSSEIKELNIGVGTYTDRFFITFSKQNVLSTEDLTPLNKELTVFMDNAAKEVVIQNNKLVKIKKVELFNLLGQKVREWKNIEHITENRLKTNKLSATVYILNVNTENGKISKKVFIE